MMKNSQSSQKNLFFDVRLQSVLSVKEPSEKLDMPLNTYQSFLKVASITMVQILD